MLAQRVAVGIDNPACAQNGSDCGKLQSGQGEYGARCVWRNAAIDQQYSMGLVGSQRK